MSWAAMDWNMIAALAGVGALLIGAPGAILSLLSVRSSLKRLEVQNEEGVKALKILTALRKIGDGDQNALWSKPLDLGEFKYHERLAKSIPIVVFANLKGGVGKTTIASNVAAAFADKGERVLALDLDYQGSLSSLFIGHAQITDKQTLDESQQRGAEMLSGQRDPYWAKTAAIAVSTDLPKLKYIPTTYDLADTENRLMIKWLVGDSLRDVRLNLATILMDDEIQKSYDRIIGNYILDIGRATHYLSNTAEGIAPCQSTSPTLFSTTKMPRAPIWKSRAGPTGRCARIAARTTSRVLPARATAKA